MSDSERRSKRQRISQACDYCRKRKSKCDGAQPVCSVCRLFDKPCAYGNAKKRGLQTGYVRGLESLLGLMIQDVPQSEMSVRSRLRNQYLGCSFVEGEFLDHTTDLWRRSDLAKDLDHLLNSNDTESDQGELQQISSLPPLSVSHEEEEPVARQDTTIEPPAQSETVGVNNPPPQNWNFLEGFPDGVSDLVDRYFQATQCWFPIVERRDILRTLYEDNEKDTVHPDNSLDEGHRLCVWSMITFSSQAETDVSIVSRCPSSWQIQSHLWERLMTTHRSFGIGHIQATLIMALCEIQRAAFTSAGILAAQAYRMLMGTVEQESSKHDRRPHVFQGCLVLDTIISALQGKVPLLSRMASRGLPKVDENALEEWEPWTSPVHDELTAARTNRHPLRVLSSFNMIRLLIEKLSMILESPMELQVLSHHASDLQIWYSNVKRQHQLNDRSTPPILVLHLTWNFTFLILFRQMRHIERQWIPLVQQAVRSISQIGARYLQLTHILPYNPLLLIFGLQAERTLQKISQQTMEPGDSADYVQLKRNLEALNCTVKNATSGNPQKVQLDKPMTEMITPSQPNIETNPQFGKSTEVIWSESESNMLLSPMSTEILTQQPEVRQHNGLNSSAYSQAMLNDSDQFDDIFDEMLSFIPSRRDNDDATTFAQNLGFLSTDLDLELPTVSDPDKNGP
ncbi:hypothetical protein P170DRAFT_478281 [Aspergillus steynii IBT 23096]|uniref:Zn(2)-C6 fungal-type domain-containing protein n=1 Tax=Aspergillus steynii IBT 23096 TaxID=1392250 RepID=A0A2I2G3I2_9EURO|nr:uncharacterized protein P170DRAFT_478281 [Aspergillus steynii IBT 23096]PLB47433.1 hypothetical protein P170DRAFT_478281 [Aspergillus steynii IBT 23096]